MGIIASRYAAALLKYVDETHSGEVVVAQAGAILSALESVPELRRAVADPEMGASRKIGLLETAAAVDSSVASLLQNDNCPPDGAASPDCACPPSGTVSPDGVCHPERSEGYISPELRRFLELLVRNGRIGDIALILRSFEDQYYQSRGITRGRLLLPSEPDSAVRDFEARLRSLIEAKLGKTLQLTTEVDESLIGGFVLEIEDKLLDASVSRQLEILRTQFVERNRRIV
ncbi:MAG: F0F1 ATP synthase subunit delta [Bacteroidales bacterium]|nr:F0F1 ATP synthase subunit delta [Bacteroidales bacterium]